MPNALTNFKFPIQGFVTKAMQDQVGKFAIIVMQTRFDAGLDISDSPAKAYSPRSPVYLKLANGATQPIGLSVHSARTVFKKLNAGAKAPREFSTLARTGSATRFLNYTELKQFLGHQPIRDLLLTGAMRRAIKVTVSNENGIVLGFSDPRQEAKMRGNERYSPSWGLSPHDVEKVAALWKYLIRQRATEIIARMRAK